MIEGVLYNVIVDTLMLGVGYAGWQRENCILRRPSATDAMTSGQSATLTATPYEVPFN